MDGLDLHEVDHMFSCCEPCVKNRRWKQIILVISFVLVTVDVVTDWLNWIQWSGVGGYDQYYFASIFERVFLCVAAVGTGLWIIELLVIVRKWINIYQEQPERIPPKYGRNFHEYLPKPDVNDSLSKQKVRNCSGPEVRNYRELEVKKNNEHLFDPEVKIYPDPGTNEEEEEESTNESPSEPDIRNHKKCLSEQEIQKCTESELGPEGTNYNKSLSKPEVKNHDKPPSETEIRNRGKLLSYLEVRDNDEPPSGPESTNDNKLLSEPEVRNDYKTSI